MSEVLVVIDTDLAVPGELDAIDVEVGGPAAGPLSAMGALVSQGDLPATVGLVHAGGALGPVTVVVRGSLGGVDVVEREATFTFVENEIRILRMHLLGTCVGASCMAEQTCGETGCRSVSVSAAELEPYQENLGRIDAGVGVGADAGDAGSFCTGLPATCGTGRRDRCDCTMCPCDVTCEADCEVRCTDSSACNTDGRMTDSVDVRCTRSTCAVDARMASNVTVVADMGADVDVDCSDASSCDVECRGGSMCLVRCQGAGTCDIRRCDDMVVSCPMMIQVCGRACP